MVSLSAYSTLKATALIILPKKLFQLLIGTTTTFTKYSLIYAIPSKSMRKGIVGCLFLWMILLRLLIT